MLHALHQRGRRLKSFVLRLWSIAWSRWLRSDFRLLCVADKAGWECACALHRTVIR